MLPTGPAFPPGKMKRVIVWFRRDLRVADNPALVAAMQMAEEVIPVYVYCPEEEGQFQPGRCSRWWLHCALRSLQADLAALGSTLLLHRAQESRTALADLVNQTGAQGMVFNHLYDPISMVRDNEVKVAMAALGKFCCSFNADLLREPWEVLDLSGRPFTSYDAFWAAHQSLPYPLPLPLPPPLEMPAVHKRLIAQGLQLSELGIMTPEEELSNVQLEYHWTPGSLGAHKTFETFLQRRLLQFDRDRAKTDRNSTSRLSPHIHFGEISSRHIYHECTRKAEEWREAGEGGSSVPDFLRQLGYREYSRYLSFHFPFTHERSLLEHLRGIPWRFDQTLFKAWRQGRTGYPLVDAGMREVWSTGWMHNRIRVVVAMFMVKNLLLPWQWGLKHFWDALLDADLECDALGWQYCAGCLADAHPFDELMDIVSESKRFDPDGNYVRRWLPMLARLPSKYIHKPWEAPAQVLEDAGVELGVNYPLPVVSLEESQTVLAAAAAVVGIGVGKEQVVGGGASAEVLGASPPAVVVAAAGPFMPPTEFKTAAAAEFWSKHHRQTTAGENGTSGRVSNGRGGDDHGAGGVAAVAGYNNYCSGGGSILPGGAVAAPTWRSSFRASDGVIDEEVESNMVSGDTPAVFGNGKYGAPCATTLPSAVSDCRPANSFEQLFEQQQHHQQRNYKSNQHEQATERACKDGGDQNMQDVDMLQSYMAANTGGTLATNANTTGAHQTAAAAAAFNADLLNNNNNNNYQDQHDQLHGNAATTTPMTRSGGTHGGGISGNATQTHHVVPTLSAGPPLNAFTVTLSNVNTGCMVPEVGGWNVSGHGSGGRGTSPDEEQQAHGGGGDDGPNQRQQQQHQQQVEEEERPWFKRPRHDERE